MWRRSPPRSLPLARYQLAGKMTDVMGKIVAFAGNTTEEYADDRHSQLTTNTYDTDPTNQHYSTTNNTATNADYQHQPYNNMTKPDTYNTDPTNQHYSTTNNTATNRDYQHQPYNYMTKSDTYNTDPTNQHYSTTNNTATNRDYQHQPYNYMTKSDTNNKYNATNQGQKHSSTIQPEAAWPRGYDKNGMENGRMDYNGWMNTDDYSRASTPARSSSEVEGCIRARQKDSNLTNGFKRNTDKTAWPRGYDKNGMENGRMDYNGWMNTNDYSRASTPARSSSEVEGCIRARQKDSNLTNGFKLNTDICHPNHTTPDNNGPEMNEKVDVVDIRHVCKHCFYMPVYTTVIFDYGETTDKGRIVLGCAMPATGNCGFKVVLITECTAKVISTHGRSAEVFTSGCDKVNTNWEVSCMAALLVHNSTNPSTMLTDIASLRSQYANIVTRLIGLCNLPNLNLLNQPFFVNRVPLKVKAMLGKMQKSRK